MLLVAKNAMEELNENIEVSVFGQESMPKSYALGRSDLIMTGVDLVNLQLFGDTSPMINTPTTNSTMCCLTSVLDWKRSKDAVTEESKIDGSRFSHGLPPCLGRTDAVYVPAGR